jgi:LDH2 family malate/lactate/ureidoglycolate dehydrogenase
MSRYSAESLERWTTRVFTSCGVPQDDARQAARLLVRSDLRGQETHGLTRLPSYVQRLAAGDFNARPHMTHRSFAGGIVMDADGAMGQVAGPHAVRLAMQALETSASVLVAIRSCGHLGALGIHALQAAEDGVFCLVGQRTPPLLAMEGYAGAAIGHNPIAFACPVPGAAPLVFDVACSVAARGHILAAAREQRPIPPGWAVDAEGRPTTDPHAALEGALLPMGGHKGIGIAMMVECLAGALAATAASFEPGANALPSSGAMARQGAFLWAVRPAAFAQDDMFGAYMAHWTDEYRRRGGDAARIPGQRAALLERERRREGIELTGALLTELQSAGARLGQPLPDADQHHTGS